ncbi:MAG: 5-oxopent-3-ene-1,2,5-tricarboxylate decarboxylase [Rhodospirillaceae bacterium]|nr:5-oxopent-3-ene-1,2,5-tricarboxylate decarboxylase [Rhodospirillaceae bacterium]HAA91334.1 5-oxopent-3-ene-1,2,5-tricarboxylate decarboxylase [Rhodospirillaceae bacterium]
MRILAFDKNGSPTLGLKRGSELIDLSEAAPDLPSDTPGLLGAGEAAMDRLTALAENPPANAVRPLEDITYHPPVWNPGKIICVGLNYEDHAAETELEKPDYPILFLRVATTLVGHGQPLIAPKASEQFDYEAEMVVVIGAVGRNVPRAQALELVAGYSVFNEGSVRDYQFKSQTWTSGKNFDGSGGFGPELVTADEVPAGGDGLKIQTRLNGETLQDGNTSDMMFKVPELIEGITDVMTLEPGDVIVSGTPPGVGFVRNPPIFMAPGDVCEVEVEGIGLLRNPIIAEA